MDRDWSILSVEVKTKRTTDVMNLADDLAIDEGNINEAFINQPALYAWWATVAAQARAISDHSKLDVERQEDYIKKTLMGELDTKVRQELDMNGEKITESKVEKAIYASEEYKAANEELFALKEKYLNDSETAITLEIARDSMNQRKDALISLGAQLRNESDNSDLSIRKQAAKDIVGSSKTRKSIKK